MKTVIKFEAIDGKMFDKVLDCIKHEEMIEEIKTAISILNPVPDDDGFYNGEGFIQQDIPAVSKAMVRIVEIAGIEKPSEFLDKPFACRFGVIGRIIDDGGNDHLYKAWSRFMNMDQLGREWGQSYFARNPEKGVQKDRTADNKKSVQV